jgi:DNA-binding transcriptional LysR family regulator
VAEGKAELGVLINLPRASGVRSTWEVRNVIGAVMRPDHPLAGRRELTIAECLAYPLVIPDERLVAYSAVRRAMARTKRAPRVSATCNRIGPLKSLVKAGVGLAFMAQIDIGPDVAAGDLKFVRLTDRDIEAPLISTVAPKRTSLSPAAKRFSELLRREVMLDYRAPGACRPGRPSARSPSEIAAAPRR